MLLLSSADFFKVNFSQKNFQECCHIVKLIDSDLDQRNVGPDLGPNCLQRFSAYYKYHRLQGKSQPYPC